MTHGIAAVIAVLASAVACAISVAPWQLWPLAPVCVVPWLVALDGASVNRSMALGLLHGVFANMFIFSFMLPALQETGRLSLPGALGVFLLLAAAQGVRGGVVGLGCALCARRGFSVVVSFPVVLVAAELIFPLAFPWFLGSTASSQILWIQLAEIGGPLAVSFWVAVANSFVAWAVLLARGGIEEARRPILFAVGLVALVTAAGSLLKSRISSRLAGAPAVLLGVVQAGVAPRDLTAPVAAYADPSQALLEGGAAVDLLVWPESALSIPTPADRLADVSGYLARTLVSRASRRSPVPVLTGITLSDADGLRNSALLFDASQANPGRYDKRILVPLGEAPVLGMSALPYRFVPGASSQPLRLTGHRISVSICYEDMLPDDFRDAVAGDGELLVNLTSDSWFRGSSGPALHLAMASLRAVEHRRYLLRATTTGQTALVAPSGEIVWTLPAEVPARGVAVAHWLHEPTLFSAWGSAPWYAAVMLFVAMSLRRAAAPPRAAS